MKCIIEEPTPDALKQKNRPIWITVDKKIDRVQYEDAKGKIGYDQNETTVRANIMIIDYASKEDAFIIAKAIKEKLESM